uniref:Uncharacterized protein n=1 Tax=Anguilla anguilla TaxID=7936 RepID=A0A0E9VXB7_ANGAN
MLEAATGKSVWASLAVQNSVKRLLQGTSENQVVYNEDIF